MKSRVGLALLFAILIPGLPKTRFAHAQEPSTAPTLKIDGAVSTSLMLTREDLKKMPRKTLSVLNRHENKTDVYEGVLVEDLRKKAGVPQGENLRGAMLAT
jgi:DMSO/TMAO reductase YedYZ molybdopterin-dependent catalytic subunit